MIKFNRNLQLFEKFKKLNLPIGHYAITSSGPMGIRDIREISDIDIICDQKLWEELSTKYKATTENKVSKMHITDNVEALYEGSFFYNFCTDAPSVEKQIAQCEMIDGLPFVDLKYILFFKKKLGRDKDKEDVKLINDYLKNHISQ